MKADTLDAEVAAKLKRIDASAGDDLTRFPDFLVIGPQRTGSSWLFRQLAKHPEILVPKEKETYYFSTLGQPEHEKFRYRTMSEFLGAAMVDSPLLHLRKLVRHKLRYRPRIYGEATASNATVPLEVIEDICRINPSIKVVMMLRQPAGRARSHAKKALTAHTDRRPDELEFEEFDRFLRASGQVAKANCRQIIENWRSCLAPKNFMLAEFRRVAEAPQELLTEVQRFLGIDHDRLPGLHELQAKVYSTGAGRLPDAVENRIQELYKASIEDFDVILDELQGDRIAEGCYCI